MKVKQMRKRVSSSQASVDKVKLQKWDSEKGSSKGGAEGPSEDPDDPTGGRGMGDGHRGP